LMKEGSGIGFRILKNLELDFRIRAKLERVFSEWPRRGHSSAAQSPLPLAPEYSQVIHHAINEAHKLNHTHVGTEHLLLGLLKERDGLAIVMNKLGLSIDDVLEEINKMNKSLEGTSQKPKDISSLPDLQKIREIAQEIDKNLLASDPRFSYVVYLSHEDGSFFHYENAFIMNCEEYLIIFTEHHNFHIFVRDEVSHFQQYKVVPPEKLNLED
jgi:hypothetical protein